MNTQDKVLLKDKVATILFTDESLIEYVETLISKVLNIPYNEVHGNLSLVTPRVNAKVTNTYSTVDAAYESNTNYLNIEINYNNSSYTDDKNMRYACNLILKQNVGKNKKQKHFKGVIQINLNNYDYFKLNKFIYKSYLMEEECHQKRSDLLYVYDINVDFLTKFNYNEIKEELDNSLKKLLYIFVCNDQEKLKELYHGNKIMEKVVNKASNLMENWYEDLYYDPEELRRLSLEEAEEKATALGMEKGIAEGIKKGMQKGQRVGQRKAKIEMAKKMLAENLDLTIIFKITGLSIKDLTKLKGNVKL